MKLLLVGASGLVGSCALGQALANPRVERVVAPSRRPLRTDRNLEAPIVDFERLPEDAAWWRADAVICALGTTMRVAGSKEAFRRVDHDYPLAVARLARSNGVETFVLNSAMGASAASPVFYSRTKGEAEEALRRAGFRSLTIVRPGLIGGERSQERPAERFALAATRLLGPILPRRLRVNPAEAIARAMIDAALAARTGIHVVCSAELTGAS